MRIAPALLAVVLVPFAVAVGTSLSGCGTTGGRTYRAQGSVGGYSEVQVDRNVFRVTYAGTIVSTQADTDERALLRSAEVARDHGYPFFVTGGSAPTGSAMSLGTNVVSIPSTTITIHCYATRPETTAIVHETDRILATLGPKYHGL